MSEVSSGTESDSESTLNSDSLLHERISKSSALDSSFHHENSEAPISKDSNDFNRNLHTLVEDTFDKQHGSEEFLNGWLKHNTRFKVLSIKDISTRVRHIARIHGLPKQFSAQLLSALRPDSELPLDAQLISAQIISHACKHDNTFVAGRDIWDILCQDKQETPKLSSLDEEMVSLQLELRSTLVLILCKLELESELIDKLTLVKDINSIAKSEISKFLGNNFSNAGPTRANGKNNLDDSKQSKTNSWGGENVAEINQSVFGRQGGLSFQKLKPDNKASGKANAVKAQQISTERSQEVSSEKEQLLNLNLTAALNSRAKCIVQEKTKTVELPEVTTQESAQYWYYTTHDQVYYLRKLASGGKPISPQDQQYLVDSLFGSQITFTWRGTVNKMIGETFFKISEKQKISLDHCTKLLGLLSSNLDEHKLSFKTSLVKMSQLCFARDPSYFTEKNQSYLSDFSNSCDDEDIEALIFEIFTEQNDDSKYAFKFEKAFDTLMNNYQNVKALSKETRAGKAFGYLKGVFQKPKDSQSKLEQRTLTAIKYINLQALHPHRVKKLFSTKILEAFLKILSSKKVEIWVRILISEILENYLENESVVKGLQFEKLLILANSAKIESSPELETAFVRIIFKSLTEKQNDFQASLSGLEKILGSLVEICATANDATLCAVILVGLKRVCEISKMSIHNVELLAFKLLDKTKISDKNLVFIENSERSENESEQESDVEDVCDDSKDKISISAIVAELILKAKQIDWSISKNFKVSKDTFNFFAQAIESSGDKQTRILSSEFFYRASFLCEIPQHYLLRLTNFLKDEVSDVKILSASTFAKGIKIISENQKNLGLETNIVDLLAQIYCHEKIIYDSKNFSDEINAAILDTFATESDKSSSIFTKNVFGLFEFLISSEIKDSTLTFLVDIINRFCKSHYTFDDPGSKIPQTLLLSLETILMKGGDIAGSVEKLFEQILLRGQYLSENILRNFFNRLLGQNPVTKFDLGLIFAANRNQDLTEGLFSILKMELVTIAIQLQDSSAFSFNLNFSLEKLNENLVNGCKLTYSNFEMLAKLIEDKTEPETSLKCLTLGSENGQSIPNNVLETINSQCKNQSSYWHKSAILIKFCTTIVNNNQSLPDQMRELIEERFRTENDESSPSDLLQLIILQSKLGSQLGGKTVEKLCFIFEKNLKSESILQTLQASTKYVKDGFTKKSLCDSFFKILAKPELKKQVPMTLIGLETMVTQHKFNLNDNQINLLVELGQRDPEYISTLTSILKRFTLTSEQKSAIDLCDIVNVQENSKFICELSRFLSLNPNSNKINSACFQRLGFILFEHQGKNVETLISLIFDNLKSWTAAIEGNILESIAKILVAGNMPTDIQEKCQNIVIAIWNYGVVKFSKSLISILELNFERSEPILKAILSKDQQMYDKFSDQTKLIFDVRSLCTPKSETEIITLLDQISKKLKTGLKLQIQYLNSILNMQTESIQLYEIIATLLLTEQMEIDEVNSKIIFKSIVSKDHMRVSSFNAFALILNNKTFFDSVESKDLELFESALLSKYERSTNIETQNAIFRCLISIANCLGNGSRISEQTLEIFMGKLKKSDPAIRGLAFGALKHNSFNIEDSVGKEFREFVSNVTSAVNNEVGEVHIIFENGGTSEFELNLLQVLVSIETWDLKCLLRTEKHFWIKELLKSNYVSKVTSNPFQKLTVLEKLDELFKICKELDDQCNLLTFLTQSAQFCKSFGENLELSECLYSMDFGLMKHLMTSEVTKDTALKVKHLGLISMISSKSNHKLSLEMKEKIVKQLLSSTTFELAKTILNSLKVVDNVHNFLETVDLIQRFDIKALSLGGNLSVGDLKQAVKLSILHSTLQKNKLVFTNSMKLKNERLKYLVTSLFKNGISFDTIFRILTCPIETKNDKTISNLEAILEIMVNYNIQEPLATEIVSEMRNAKVDNWISLVTKLIVGEFKNRGGLKSIPQIVKDISHSLQDKAELLNLIRIADLENAIQLVKSGSIPSVFYELSHQNEITGWSKDDIYKWAKLVRGKFRRLELQINYDFSIEALCVAKRAFYLCTNFHLTNVQIVAILTGLNKGLKGQLQQVTTGSGKSCIVAILSVINGLRFGAVDIYTSSPVLAERDSKSWSKFYSYFGLTASHNGDGGIYTKGVKTCYNANIVYGETSMFQFDYLRDKYSNLGTMGKRQFHFAIVDEVDSMFVDDLSKLARLSSVLPGMDLLQVLYHFTWYRLISIEKKLFTLGENTYFVEGKISYSEDNKAYLEVADKGSGEILKEDDLVGYIKVGANLEAAGITLVNDLQQFVTEHLTEFLTALTTAETVEGFDAEIQGKVKVPKHLQYFVQNQIPKWVDSSITALNYQANIHFIVEDGQIKPVDYNTTGIVQDSTAWSGGLHQFLQIKHGLKVTSETVTTNFLSNLSLFQKYQHKLNSQKLITGGINYFDFTEYNIIGFTGTLGSSHTRETLSTLYNVNCIEMPETYHKVYTQYPDVLIHDRVSWHGEVLQSIKSESRKGRGVLVICETIRDAIEISKQVKSKCPGIHLKLYTQNNSNQEEQIERIQPGEVFIATNLAGRGTDIKTADIESFGGLHVVLTFLPNNSRVEEQAFGRTGRQGNLGSGQLICICSSLVENSEIRQIRNEQEKCQMEMFLENDLPLLKAKDQCFEGFCRFLRQIRENLAQQVEGKDSNFQWVWGKVKSLAGYERTPTTLELNTLQAVEERWAMFLAELEDRRIPTKEAWGYYKFFELALRINCRKDRVIRSPFYHIAIGNEYFIKDSKGESSCSEAKYHYEKAIELDPEFATGAYTGLGFLLLSKDNKELNYRSKALSLLEKALHLINNEITHVVAALSLFQTNGGAMDSGLFKQLTMKQTALNSYSNSLQSAIGVASRAIRPIDITARGRYGDGKMLGVPYCNKNESFTFTDDSRASGLINCEGLERTGWTKFDLSFKDLTRSSDSGDKDQATRTIKESKQNADIVCRGLGFDSLLKVFLKDTFVDQMGKEGAIACVNEWQSQAKRLMILNKSIEISVHLVSTEEINETVASNASSAECIEAIQELEDTDYVNLTYKAGNETLYNTFKDAEVNLKVNDLKPQGVTLLLEAFSSNSINLNIRSQNTNLVKQLAKLEDEDFEVELIQTNTDGTWGLEKHLLSEMDFNNHSETNEITILNMTETNIQNILPQFSDCLYDLLLVKLNKSAVKMRNLRKVKHLLKNCDMTFVQPKKYSQIIAGLRSIGCPITVHFSDLSLKDARFVLSKADLSQEPIYQSKLKRLNELFATEWMPTTELWEFQIRGILVMCEFNEKSPIPWFSIGCVVAIAAVQMALGAFLICTGFGATVGMGFITEGTADIFTAYRANANRKFSWEDYTKHKAVSLAISAVSMGWSKLKDAAKGATVVLEGAAKEVGEQVATNCVVSGADLALKASGQNLQDLAFKQIGVSVAEAGAREVINGLVDMGSQLVISEYKSHIVKSVETRVIDKFYIKPDLKRLLGFYWALDRVSKSNELNPKILRVVGEITNPNNSFWVAQWNSVGYPLLQGILSSSQNVGGVFSVGFRIAGILAGLHEITTVVDSVCNAIVEKLKGTNGTAISVMHILVQKCHLEIQEAQKLEKFIQLDSNDKEFISFTFENVTNRRVQEFFMKLNELQCEFKMEEVDVSIKSVADSLSEHIITVADKQIIAPISTFMVGKGVASLSAYIQTNFVVNSKHNTKDLEGKSTITVADQINANAKQYTVAYQQIDIEKKISQSEIANDASNKSQGKINAQVIEKAREVLNGGPADLAIISTLAKINGLNLELITDKNEIPSNMSNTGKIVLLYEAGTEGDSIGHYSLVNTKTGEIIPIQSNNLDCGYAAIAELTGKSVQQLRVEVAEHMIHNHEVYDKVIENQQWIQSHYPEEANKFLLVGGRRLTTDETVAEMLDRLRQEYRDLGEEFQLLEESDFSVNEEGNHLIVTKTDNVTKMLSPENEQEVELPTKVYAIIICGAEGRNVPINEMKEVLEVIQEQVGTTYATRDHVVSARAGGPPEGWNLVPSTKRMNSQHYQKVETVYLPILSDADFKALGGYITVKQTMTYPDSPYVQPVESKTVCIRGGTEEVRERLDDIMSEPRYSRYYHKDETSEPGQTLYKVTIRRNGDNVYAVPNDDEFSSTVDGSSSEDRESESGSSEWDRYIDR